MYHWSLWRKYSGHAVPRIADHFFVMNEEEMSSFFVFRDNKENSVCIEDDVLFPERELLKIYCRENQIAYKTTVRYGTTFSHIPIQQIDDLCDWISKKRELS